MKKILFAVLVLTIAYSCSKKEVVKPTAVDYTTSNYEQPTRTNAR